MNWADCEKVYYWFYGKWSEWYYNTQYHSCGKCKKDH